MDPTRRRFVSSMACAAALGSLGATARAEEVFEVVHSDEEWLALLGKTRFEVLRRSATERPYTSRLNDEHRNGVFQCAGCKLPLFSSVVKFDSRTGWPSFWEPVEGEAVETERDWSLLMPRTEVHCAVCGGHLGHVFPDGPHPTGQRYCINSAALDLEREQGKTE